MRPAIIAVGGRAWLQAAERRGRDVGEEKERESEVRSATRKRWTRRMESDVGNRVFGTEKRFSGVRVQVLGGFELNDEK